MGKVAELAAGHLKPVWHIVASNWTTIELSAVATAFGRTRDTGVIDRLAKLEVALYPFHLENRKSGSPRPEPETLDYQAFAWRQAVEAFFKSEGTATCAQMKAAEIYIAEEPRAIRTAYYKDRERSPPACSGGLRKAPEPVYPASALREGYVGAVIEGFGIVDAKMENARVLAAAPDRQFEEAVMKTMKSMKTMEWYFDEVQRSPDCVRTDNDRPGIIPFNFVRTGRAFVTTGIKAANPSTNLRTATI
ncbi:MAG: hypothetical protein WEA77_14265 [Hyphomonas sp.]|uniref:hypothetical protein n=1 Tax=Hyphomonas sp. TaxID=87 RepID=UPI00349FF01F